jgi:cytochrome c biogenesis protein CcdA
VQGCRGQSEQLTPITQGVDQEDLGPPPLPMSQIESTVESMSDKKFNLLALLTGLALTSIGSVGALLRLITGADTAFAVPTVMMVVGFVAGIVATLLALAFMATTFVEKRLEQKNRAKRELEARQMRVLLAWPVR